VCSKSSHQLQKLEYALEQRAHHAEAQWRPDVYRPNYYLTLTFRGSVKSDRAVFEVKRFLVNVSRSVGRHVFWYGWYDDQPNRGLDGRSYTHFHLFVEVEGLPLIKSGVDDVLRAKVELCLLGWDGNADLRDYRSGGGAIKYSVSGHGEAVEVISCPRKKRMCNKRGRVCAYVWKDGMFVDRHK